MARPQVPDTTALIEAIRRPRASQLLNAISEGNLWLSAVVVYELLVGTRSADERLALEQLVAGARRGDRLLVPSFNEWSQAGTLIARRVRLRGPIRPRDHLADVLIVVSAARVRGEVLTANRRHFEPWADLARRAGLDVAVAASP